METNFSLGDLIISKKYPTKVVEIINIIHDNDIQVAVECKVDNGSSYIIDTFPIDSIVKYGTEYKVRRLFCEKWFPIPGFDNYELSSYGRIKSLKPFGSNKFEKILFTNYQCTTIRKENENPHYAISFGGVRLYQNGQRVSLLRREVMELVPEYEIINDPGFEEIYGSSFLNYMEDFRKNRHPLEKRKSVYLHKNLSIQAYHYNKIVWDCNNELWCFNCHHAGGYDCWDDSHCFFTNLRQAQGIHNRLNYFQPKLEAKFRESEVLPPT